ncbi:hypothetical protein PHBOTO_006171 [Pseudozyma hubeiensis]|nr:hypothetical protein PHBOTO_006678 [Pseudozyma hubeiensis]KAJ9476094.1 hypothetical protein PHBOTO_006171 [Pseudozyma hubeiensis]
MSTFRPAWLPILFVITAVLCCLKPASVRAGASSSTSRVRYTGVAKLGGDGTEPGMVSSRHDDMQHLSEPVPSSPQLPAELSIFKTPNIVMEPAIRVLPSKLHDLGFRHATVTLHDSKYANLNRIEDLVLTQMKSNPNRKQFMPIFSGSAMKTYAMPLDHSAVVRWPNSVGRVAGKDNVSKAAILSVYDPGELAGMGRSIRLYGIVKIKNANTLHQPSSQAQQLMHNVPEMLRL